MSLLIKGGHIVDASCEVDEVLDLFIENGKIVRLGKDLTAIKDRGLKIIDARRKKVIPGLIDMHCHLRQPGRDDEETFQTAASAAAKGGFTTIMCMPNTYPVIDNAPVVEWILRETEKLGIIRVIPVGAITKNQEGKELSEIGELKQAGVYAISDDGRCVADTNIMRRALEYAKQFNLVVISHCEDLSLSAGGQVNEGYNSTLLGLKGIPEISETIIVAREIELARFLNTKIHLAHISCARSVELIRRAKKQGIQITAETCPHHFSLTQDANLNYDSNTKVNPPLRSREDVEALKQGLKDGTIDCIATDHAPHAESEKELAFDCAPFGLIGLETALSLTITELIDEKIINWMELVRKFSYNPARILGLDRGAICEGAVADVTIVDPNKEWTVIKENIVSLSKNTPFIGRNLKGVVEGTICNGKVVYEA